jgi:hypothetical protein
VCFFRFAAADQANAHREDEERLKVSPHVLCHTFLRSSPKKEACSTQRKRLVIEAIAHLAIRETKLRQLG